jgi:hypothetical protein
MEFISQHKKNYAFAFFNQFIVSLSAPALTHCVSTTFIDGGGGGGGGAATPTVQLNSIFSAKTDPKRKSGKKTLIPTSFSSFQENTKCDSSFAQIHVRLAYLFFYVFMEVKLSSC